MSGGRRIRTTESTANRFTVCPLWPLGNPSIPALTSTIYLTTRGLKNQAVFLLISQHKYNPSVAATVFSFVRSTDVKLLLGHLAKVFTVFPHSRVYTGLPHSTVCTSLPRGWTISAARLNCYRTRETRVKNVKKTLAYQKP